MRTQLKQHPTPPSKKKKNHREREREKERKKERPIVISIPNPRLLAMSHDHPTHHSWNHHPNSKGVFAY
jgi:hypothetical protein